MCAEALPPPLRRTHASGSSGLNSSMLSISIGEDAIIRRLISTIIWFLSRTRLAFFIKNFRGKQSPSDLRDDLLLYPASSSHSATFLQFSILRSHLPRRILTYWYKVLQRSTSIPLGLLWSFSATGTVTGKQAAQMLLFHRCQMFPLSGGEVFVEGVQVPVMCRLGELLLKRCHSQ